MKDKKTAENEMNKLRDDLACCVERRKDLEQERLVCREKMCQLEKMICEIDSRLCAADIERGKAMVRKGKKR